MEHIKMMAVKFFISLALLYVILGIGYDVSFGNVFLITLVLGVLSYILGDRIILPRTNNTVATISDFVLSFVVIYLMTDALTVGDDVLQATLISSIALTIFEYFFHKYVASNLDDQESTTDMRPRSIQTESAEEIHPIDKEENYKKNEE
ncbi:MULTISPECIES: YndM family protein [Gracilibacillus]|uniref:DUF2512 domain-containing protein n=1 Tax=Gracilibacillus dipsosauri TaxID=178340 RepID=A0A317KW33_9BACI|nr:YndM family protein [Gracilibacillus dipsosauri]PWU66638.1 DUF2512 domain-containing protein [Gracilibacillus dipsosauri]